MTKTIITYKQLGQTPLDVIKKLKQTNVELKDKKLAYAGRLDPMAEGLLLILVGDECKNRDKYEKLSKTYEFEVLFGVSTDSYDLLGLITNSSNKTINKQEIERITLKFLGKQNQPYPPYSAARVNGKPLYYWAREGKLDQIKIPEKQIEVYSFELGSMKQITSAELKKSIFERISKVHGKFRQAEIKEKWKEFFQNNKTETFQIAKFTISCSSGTYVRSIANDLGKKLGTHSLAFSIKRTKIGDYFL